MRRTVFLTLLTIFSGVWAADAAAGVKVNFVDPDHYTDANLRREYGKAAKEPAMREMERYLWRLGEEYLAPDQTLTVDVLDIDLAGRFEPWQFNYKDVRFMRSITWPAMKLRYRLESPNHPVQEGEETVADRFYLDEAPFSSSIDTMGYEKIMLQRWFRRHFAGDGAAK